MQASDTFINDLSSSNSNTYETITSYQPHEQTLIITLNFPWHVIPALSTYINLPIE